MIQKELEFVKMIIEEQQNCQAAPAYDSCIALAEARDALLGEHVIANLAPTSNPAGRVFVP